MESKFLGILVLAIVFGLARFIIKIVLSGGTKAVVKGIDKIQKMKEAKQENTNKKQEQHTQEKKRWEDERDFWKKESQKSKEEAREAQEEAFKYKEEARVQAEQKQQRNADEHINKDENYYANVLGLDLEYVRKDLDKRYRELATKYHPDLVNHLGDKLKETADTEMKVINEANNFFKKKYNI